MADPLAEMLRQRWSALAAAGAVWTQPWLELDRDEAQARIDPRGRLGELAGTEVLCLAAGGGQQAVAFALLGSAVTSVDLTPVQVEADRRTAGHHGCAVDARQGDMRDLSALGPASFDIVWHGYSLNFVPDPAHVFREVRRVLRAGGRYVFMCANPFVAGISIDDWRRDGYLLRRPYVDGEEIVVPDEEWVAGGAVPPSRERRHALGRLVEGLRGAGFCIDAVDEAMHAAPDAPPGSWAHLTTWAPPWLELSCTAVRPAASP